ncbi:MAG: molybdate ABC transporter substrate-binding protein [Rhodospirillaceae bacterium]
MTRIVSMIRAFRHALVDVGRRHVAARRFASAVMRCASMLLLALSVTEVGAQPITVSAAASLRDVLQSVNAAYEKRNHEHVSTVYGPSFRLANDIARGAIPDVFISADPASVAYLEEHKLVRGDVLIGVVRNRLVVVARDGYGPVRSTKAGPGTAIKDMASLALPDPRQHPAGKFGQAALTKLGLWDRLGSKTRTTSSTRAALELVLNREVDGAIVYRSEAMREPHAQVIQMLPENSHPPILYTVAVTTAGRGWPVVSAYVSFIRSQAALDIFERFGFERDAAWKK